MALEFLPYQTMKIFDWFKQTHPVCTYKDEPIGSQQVVNLWCAAFLLQSQNGKEMQT